MPLQTQGYVYRVLLSAMAGCLSVFALFSCSAPNQCASHSTEGNIGAALNTPADEYAPLRMNNTILFSSSRLRSEEQQDAIPKHIPEALYEAVRRGDGSFAPPDINRSLPLNTMGASSPTIATNEDGTVTLIFSASRTQGKKVNVELYQSNYSNGVWSQPRALEELNSPFWESQPALAPDASYLVFASDRSGGLGGIDLYISYRQGAIWSVPKNLGSGINTPSDDITPSIGRHGELFFASRGYHKRSSRDFDVLYARVREPGGMAWEAARTLPAPFSSTADDVSPLMWGDSLIFASKREGGCGGYDLYTAGLCGPVYVRGEVLPSQTLTRRAGVLSILDSTGKFAQIQIREDGKFEVKLFPNRKYIARYLNACDPHPYEHEFTTPCDEFNTVVLDMPIQLPDLKPSFSVAEYNIPFFSSGYYMPSTTEQLAALRSKFSYNLLGTSDSTRYIRNPGEEWDEYAPMVDSAIANAADFILRALQYRREGCITNGSKILVTIEGYADNYAHQLAAGSSFAGESIEDEEMQTLVRRGAKMNNALLATLRAYFMAKSIQQRLERSSLYMQNKSWVSWQLQGKKSNEEQSPESVRRSIEVHIRLE